MNVVLERIFVQYYNNIADQINIDRVNLSYYVWLVRKITILICITSLLYSYFSYKDEHFENFKLLKSIESRLRSLPEINISSTTPSLISELLYSD